MIIIAIYFDVTCDMLQCITSKRYVFVYLVFVYLLLKYPIILKKSFKYVMYVAVFAHINFGVLY